MRTREVEPRSPVAHRPQQRERGAARDDLLGDERPHSCPRQGEHQARDPADESSDVGADRKLAEPEMPLEVGLLHDGEPGDDDQDGQHLDDLLQLRHVVHARPPPGECEARSREHEAPDEIHPERGIEVRTVELLSLDDRRQEPLLQREVDEGEVDEGHRDDPERLRPEDRREDDREEHREAALAPAQGGCPAQRPADPVLPGHGPGSSSRVTSSCWLPHRSHRARPHPRASRRVRSPRAGARCARARRLRSTREAASAPRPSPR